MPALGNALDFFKYEGRNFRAHQLGAAPASPATGQVYYNTADNTLYWFDGALWQSAKGGGASGVAGGDLGGSYPNPTVVKGQAGFTIGGAAAVVTGDARLSDARTPTAHKATHEPGGSDPLTVGAAAGVGSLRTVGPGALEAMAGNTRLDQIAAPTADVTVNSRKLINVADPVGAQDAATKAYVDATAQGLDAKGSVRAATTANLAALSGAQTVDTVALVAGDRVLVKDQAVPSANGIYVVAAGAWTRATDADTWNELVAAYTWVEQGATNPDSGWVATVDQGGTIGTTAVTWTQFSGAGQITAGAGLTKTGNSLDVGAAAGITVAADTVGVAAGGVTNAMLAGAIDAATKLTGAVPVANGGTGQTAAKAARETGLLAAGYYTSATHGAGVTIAIAQATHGLRASRGLIVQVQDEASGAVEIPDVVVAANGDVSVTYGVAVAANSKRVTVIG